jgi:DnaJ-class molecular chaperone
MADLTKTQHANTANTTKETSMAQEQNLSLKVSGDSTTFNLAAAGPGTSSAGEPVSAPSGNVNPGDEAPAGTPGTGENICRDCGGSGRVDDAPCPCCGGSGKVITTAGDA